MIAEAYIQRQALISGKVESTSVADRGAAERADRLEGEGAEHQFAAAGAGNAFGDDHVRGRIIATEREADAEQADHQEGEVGAEDQRHQERAEDHHLGDEHRLAAEAIRQAAEADGADQNAEQARRADDAMLGGADVEFARDQRKRDAGHEDDEAFEEFAGGGQRPDQPLHPGHRRRRKMGPIGPHRQLVDMVLNRSCAGIFE